MSILGPEEFDPVTRDDRPILLTLDFIKLTQADESLFLCVLVLTTTSLCATARHVQICFASQSETKQKCDERVCVLPCHKSLSLMRT